jgi:hypothetical protein
MDAKLIYLPENNTGTVYAPRRAALLTLCSIAVVVAASLFPASGVGSYPAGAGEVDLGLGDRSAPELDDRSGLDGTGDADTPGTPDGPTGTDGADGPTPTDGTAGSTDATDGSTDRADGSTPTPTATPTDTPAASDGPGGGPSLDAGTLVGAFFAVGVLVLLGGLSLSRLGYRRRGIWLVHPSLPDLPPAPVRTILAAIPRTTMGFVVGLSGAAPRLLDDAATVLGTAASAAGLVARGAVRGTTRTLLAVPSAFAAGTGGLLAGVGRTLGSLPGAVASLGGSSWRPSSSATPGSTGDAEEADAGPLTVEEAWSAMTDRVPARDRRALTPGEYARRAVGRGLPSGAVATLTRLFREVRYGGRPEDDDRTAAARDAYDDIDGGDGK